MNYTKPGYILVLTLIVLGLGMAIATRMFYQASAYLPLASLVAKREQAKTLALGGVQLAISHLSGPQQEKKSDLGYTKVVRRYKTTDASGGERDVTAKVKEVSAEGQFLERVLPGINRWESFNLTEEVDGVDGRVAFCITCEDGKINLNNMYDFRKRKFKDSLTEKSKYNKSEVAEQVLQKLFLEIEKVTKGAVNGAAALRAVVNFLKERKYQLLDVTELLQIPELSYFKDHVFYQPPLGDVSEGESRPIYLTDLFTTWTNTSHLREGVTLLLQPWLLSDSILAILRFPRAQANDIMKRKQSVQEWVKNFNPTWSVAFKQYGSFSVPNEITDLFASKFEPKVFGVLAKGTVGAVEQSLYAIVRADDGSKDLVKFTVDKLYWI